MKKFKVLNIFLLMILILTAFLSVGCSDRELDYAQIQREDENIGGDLSFEYDSQAHIAFFGGQGEVVSYYDEDIARGFKEAGNRIGIKLYAPKGIDDYQSGQAKLGNEELNGGMFYTTVNQNYTGEAVFYPKVDENNTKIEIKIIWQAGTKEQRYMIVIREGTTFAPSTT